ncbi:Cof-type HAD-IIB family hydrolase [Clostridium hydrogenum]|uniref:Cof-type HAD-IIB family hydrolase n=1 Tax=Clostridium hydrogenum TaxID=2855764 RepID=UPI002E363C2B|nr:Cof-type HAD-IIB family hydrolase [Clostridium hydrogenum]
MKRKMIFFDIDGTIVDEETHIIPESAIKAIRKARENGHLVFINTGRTFFNVTDDVREIGFDGYVCGCGTYIFFDGQPVLAKSIPHEKCVGIIKKLRECKIDGLLEGLNDFFFDQTKALCAELAKSKSDFEKRGYNTTRSWDEPDIVFDKFVTWTNEESNLESFKEYISKDFDYIDRGGNFGEIVIKGFSKATGIKFLQDYFDVSIEDCYAIGDSNNDLPMLQYVPNSIAMGNSTPSLFDKVSFVTKDIMDGGIEYALKHYGII